jgi:hypothetical protein
MNEADWLKAKNPLAMLELVQSHLSTRQWNLLACMFVRKLGKLLADERIQQALGWCEQNAGLSANDPARAARADSLPAVVVEVIEAAQNEQRAIVQDVTPDAQPEEFHHVEGRKTNPAAPLFQAAAQRGRQAVDSAFQAAIAAGESVDRLTRGIGDSEALRRLRSRVVDASREQALSGLHSSLALKLKARGDEMADRDTGRDVGKRYAAALDAVEREQEYAGYRENDLYQQKERSDRKALGAYLLELCGNVCRPPVIDPSWLTHDVLALALQVDAERDWASLPILGDALLDAGCNSRQILRHLRGFKEHADEPIPHAPGCWVIDLILAREQAFRQRLPLGTTTPPSKLRKRNR